MTVAVRDRAPTLAKARQIVDRDFSSGSFSRPDPSIRLPENSCRDRGLLAPQDAQRAWVAGLIWEAFPAPTITKCSKAAAKALSEMGVPTSERQVRYLLNCEHDASFQRVNAILSLVGPHRIFDVVTPQPPRRLGAA